MWGHNKVSGIYKEESSQLKPQCLAPWCWTSQPPELGEINVCCLYHSHCGILSGCPKQPDTPYPEDCHFSPLIFQKTSTETIFLGEAFYKWYIWVGYRPFMLSEHRVLLPSYLLSQYYHAMFHIWIKYGPDTMLPKNPVAWGSRTGSDTVMPLWLFYLIDLKGQVIFTQSLSSTHEKSGWKFLKNTLKKGPRNNTSRAVKWFILKKVSQMIYIYPWD